VNALCIGCHEGQKDGTHVTAIVPGGHVVGGPQLEDPKRDGREFSCASCHNPHGSNTERLLYFGKTAMDSCTWCHGDKSGEHPELKNVISNARRSSAAREPPGAGAGGHAGAPGAARPDGGAP
jgi:predicted CXXCH cytochrome family protein